ncbi:MAG TPA: CBS domain-containing protein [Gemmataceae bacterium]|nr:CBS domain-containing protein [Gemmataceae bacterium]
MGTVSEILATKGSHVLTIGAGAIVMDAALLMNEHKVGSLVVTEGSRPIGIFTERDILQRVVALRRDPATTRVADVMTAELACCRPETTIEEARGAMKNRRIRHLPVVDSDRRLLGLVSIGDLNAYHLDSQEQTIHLMNEYIHGRV